MKLVVDTNRIIAALIKDSVSRKIILHTNAELFMIDFSDEEIKKYKKMILKKTGINEFKFNIILEKLKEKMMILDDEIILSNMPEARKIMNKIDPDDAPFIAAALAMDADIWSDDKHFDKQKKVKIWKTKDLVGLG